MAKNQINIFYLASISKAQTYLEFCDFHHLLLESHRCPCWGQTTDPPSLICLIENKVPEQATGF